MKFGKDKSSFLLAFQLLVNVCHVMVHNFALGWLWTRDGRPSALSKLLIYAGGLSCIAFVGIVGSRLQRKQKRANENFPENGSGNVGSLLALVASFIAEGLTMFIVQ